MRRLVWWGLLLGGLGLPNLQAAETGAPSIVFVSILPQQTFVQELAGPRLVVKVLVAPGQSPETYEPAPNQIKELLQAKVYFRLGVNFETVWMKRIQSVNPDLWVVETQTGIRLRSMETHQDPLRSGRPHERTGSPDPHIWLAPALVKVQARNIHAALVKLDPGHAQEYDRNLERFLGKLDALDRDLKRDLSGLKHKRIMVYHPSWGYFADAYGLTQIPIEMEGKEPGPRSLARLIDQAERENVRVIFVQQQFSTKTAEAVAQEVGARVIPVDDLALEYFQNMRRMAAAIKASDR